MHSQTIFTILASVASLATANPLARRATCPSTDNDGSALLSQSLSDGFTVCRYVSARTCTYFPNGGFDSGSSVCPGSIPAARRRRGLVANQPAAGLPSSATCANLDDNGGALLSTSVSDGFTVCQYEKAGQCAYFSNGSFSSGGSVCPDSITGAAAPQTTVCPAQDDNGSYLISVGVDDNGNEVECQYQAAGLCTYFSNGSFSSGSSVCPDSISAAAAQQKTVCPTQDNNGSSLVSVGVDDKGNQVECQYAAAGLCTYFSNGSFSSGSSVCPSSI